MPRAPAGGGAGAPSTSSLEQLAPGLIIAAPALADPNFDHAVVLLCMHDARGALGLVLSRPAPVTPAEVMRQMGIAAPPEGRGRVMLGGPVAVESGLVLYEPAPGAPLRDDELAVTDRLRLCPNREVLEAIGRGDGPERFLIFLGHSGWGPGQLEREIAQGAWVPARLRQEIVFDVPAASRWEEALRGEGLTAAQVGAFRPQA